jgi:uncharacterized membrane protein (DUF485 family)
MASADWERIRRSPEFEELVAKRRRFVLPATVFFLAWYFGFIILSGYAEGFMGESLYQGFTVGYALALTQFVMVAVLGTSYLRYSERVLDPLRSRIVQRESVWATAAGDETAAARPVEAGRFAREPAPPLPPREVKR